jgi:hypothetical protein
MHRPKFRAWNITKRKMINSYLTFDKQGHPILKVTEPTDHLIPLEYSAYKDRQRKEICEGDILKDYWEGGYTLNEVVFIEKAMKEVEAPGWQVDFIRAYDTSLAGVDRPIAVSEGGLFPDAPPRMDRCRGRDYRGQIPKPRLLRDMRRDHFYP